VDAEQGLIKSGLADEYRCLPVPDLSTRVPRDQTRFPIRSSDGVTSKEAEEVAVIAEELLPAWTVSSRALDYSSISVKVRYR